MQFFVYSEIYTRHIVEIKMQATINSLYILQKIDRKVYLVWMRDVMLSCKQNYYS